MNDKYSFIKNTKRLEKQLSSALNERAEKLVLGLSDGVVDLFEHNAKQRLRSRATPKEGISELLVENVCENITHEEMGYYSPSSGRLTKKITVIPDKENLYMFLEYGTGFRGWWNQNPDAHKAGWEYVVNPSHHVRKEAGIAGWFFNFSGDNYLDKNDEYPNVVKVKYTQTTQMGGGFTDKNGRHVRRYRRRRNTNKTGEFSEFIKEYTQYKWAFSTGIEAVRYFYDTKQELRNVISELRRRLVSEDEHMSIKDIKEFLEAKKL